MAFLKTNVLTTREPCFGARRLGQILAVPSGRLDKVAVYLEPNIVDIVAAASIDVIVEVYNLDMMGNPIGAPLASDFKALSELTIRGFYNFRIESFVPTIVAIVVRVPSGDQNNFVAWRYVNASSGGEELLISNDNGATWIANPTRKFSYKTFSLIPNAIDVEDQTALIQAGSLLSITDIPCHVTSPSPMDGVCNAGGFTLAEFNGTAVTGSTLAINFGDFVITLVIDQSGSMTWNDHGDIRFDMLKDFINNIDSILPPSSTATYSLVKFRGRRIGNLTIGIQGAQNGLHLDGIRVIRKSGSPPISASPPDGQVVFEGLAEQFVDEGLTPGFNYYYGAFAFANLGGNVLYSSGRTDFNFLTTPITAPLSISNIFATPIITDSGGTPLVSGAVDFGYRKVNLSWLNPSGFDYSTITLVRRDDRFPESPLDGTILLNNVSAATTSFSDSFGGTYQFTNGLTYFYRIFTTNSLGIKSILANSVTAQAAIPSTPRPWEQLELNLLYPAGHIPPVGFDVTPPGPPVVAIIESNGEMQISWTPADSDTKRYKLFYNPTSFPIATDDHGRNYTGTLLLDGTATTFFHRFLDNAQPHFYVLIALDTVENASTPVKPLVGTRPPMPSATATQFLPPDPVSNLEVDLVNGTTLQINWKNPQGPTIPQTFYFGDTIRVVSNVQFIDQGNSESFLTFEFIESQRSVKLVDPNVTVDPNIAIVFANVLSANADSIQGVVSVTPLIDLQNKLEEVSITMHAALRVRNRNTNAVLAEVSTGDITIKLENPFALDVINEPAQFISRRTWGPAASNVEGDPCQSFEYKSDSIAGVYVFSGDPFFALVECSFRGLPLGGPLNVTVSFLDPTTGQPSTLIKLAQAGGQTQFVLQTSDVTDETLDRSGMPTGSTTTRSLLPLTLPPSNVPGNFILQASGNFAGYIRTAQLPITYEPILNMDLNLTPYQPDNVDRTQQSAFVYLAPFDADDSAKVPVPDFTVTSWSIRPLCIGGHPRPLQSEDDVPGVGIKAFTRGGLASKIFWGPGNEVSEEQLYEVHVKVQAQGMSGEGFGVLALEPPDVKGFNKIFLKNVTGGDFGTDTIFADGIATSSWVVIAKPEDNGDISDTTSGKFFRQAVLTVGGIVPSLDDGRIITLNAKVNTNAKDPNALGGQDVTSNVRIFTNLTGPNGKSKSANAQIENGVAAFSISVDATVPEAKDTINEKELYTNLFYSQNFQIPQTSVYLTLTALVTAEVNGHPIAFYGGGGDPIASAPPCFLTLLEPLNPK